MGIFSKYVTTNFHLDLESLIHIQGQSKWFTVRDLGLLDIKTQWQTICQLVNQLRT